MAAVVFMRGVYVGGHRPFRPAAFAKELSAFDLINIGAAGTFIILKTVSEATLRAEFFRRLPLKAEFMICRARDLIDLAPASGDSPQVIDKSVSSSSRNERWSFQCG